MKLHHWIIIVFLQIASVALGLWIYHLLQGGTGIEPGLAISLWAALVTIVFVVFSLVGMKNIDGKISELVLQKEKQEQTFKEIEASSKQLIDSAHEARKQIVDQAEKEIKKLLDRSTTRQNYFDQVTGINNELMPDKRVLAFTNFLRENKDVEGIDYAYIYIGRGNAYMALNKYSEAKDDYEMALQVCQPINREKALSALAGYYVNVQDFPKSIEYFKQALELNPDSALLCMDLGNSYNAIHQFDEAEKYYKRALTYNPELAEIYYNKAIKIRDSVQYADKEQLKAYLDKCIDINPMFIPAHLSKAGLLIGEQRHEEAITELSSIIGKVFHPDIVQAIALRGEAYRLSGQTPMALPDFLLVHVLHPDNLKNMANLAAALLEMHLLRESYYFANKGLELGNKTNDHTFDQALALVVKAVTDVSAPIVPSGAPASDKQ